MSKSLFTLMFAAEGPSGLLPYETSVVIQTVLIILMSLLSIGIIITVLMQKSQGEDMSAITGGSSGNDSFYGKNKAQTREGLLRKLTVIFAVAILLVSVAYFVIALI